MVGRPKTQRNSAVLSRGTIYERRIQQELSSEFGDRFRSDVFFRYEDRDGEERELQPDGILVLPDRVVLLECKLKSSAIMWFQLHHMYGPLAREAFVLPICYLAIVQHLRLPVFDVDEQPFEARRVEDARESGWWVMERR